MLLKTKLNWNIDLLSHLFLSYKYGKTEMIVRN